MHNEIIGSGNRCTEGLALPDYDVSRPHRRNRHLDRWGCIVIVTGVTFDVFPIRSTALICTVAGEGITAAKDKSLVTCLWM